MFTFFPLVIAFCDVLIFLFFVKAFSDALSYTHFLLRNIYVATHLLISYNQKCGRNNFRECLICRHKYQNTTLVLAGEIRLYNCGVIKII